MTRMMQRGGLEADILAWADAPYERELVVAVDTGAFWVGNGVDVPADLPKQGPATIDAVAGIAQLPNGSLLPVLDPETSQLPNGVRAVLAANLGDQTTPEGAAVLALQGENAMTYAGSPQIEVLKPEGDSRPGVWEFIHDGVGGYLLHLMTGEHLQGAGSLIGMGIDNGGIGLFVNNKKTGVGINVQQNDSITSPTAFGIYGHQLSTVAPLMHFDQDSGAAQTFVLVSAESGVETNPSIEIIASSTSAAGGGYGGGYVSAKSGNIYWRSDVVAIGGAHLRAKPLIAGDGNNTVLEPDGVRFATWNGANGGYWQKRIAQSGQSLLLQAGDATSGGPDTAATWRTGIELKQVNGLASGTQLGFYGAAPVARQAAPVAASDAASTQTAINAIRTALISLGLLS